MSGSLTVYYDGACPLCLREIAFYRRCRGADGVVWTDVSADGEGKLAAGLCQADALARFHVRTADGRLESGAQAFAQLWAALPAFRWLGLAARTPIALPLLEMAYRGFLRIRPRIQRWVARRNARARC